MDEKDIIIIAPHPDDELIGCYQMLETGRVETVLFGENSIEGEKCAGAFGFVPRPYSEEFLNKTLGLGYIYLFPDVIYEYHPTHRYYGMIGEKLARNKEKVLFYSVNMQAPYVHQLEPMISFEKRRLMDSIYPGKKDLWKYDHKYFLFEGYNQWLFLLNKMI